MKLLVVLFCVFLGSQALPSQFIIDGHDDPSNIEYVKRLRSFRTPDALQALQYTGFFISSNYLMTVAQAIHNFQYWEIEVDLITIYSNMSLYHDDYNSQTLANNYGMILFPNAYLGQLPALATSTTIVEPTFFVFGFGVTDVDGNLPSTLQRGLLRQIDLPTCRQTFGSTVANDNVFCGQAAFPSDGFTRICSGDQGGPAINAWTGEVVGIASFWWDCNDTLQPQGFTLLSSFVDFPLTGPFDKE